MPEANIQLPSTEVCRAHFFLSVIKLKAHNNDHRPDQTGGREVRKRTVRHAPTGSDILARARTATAMKEVSDTIAEGHDEYKKSRRAPVSRK